VLDAVGLVLVVLTGVGVFAVARELGLLPLLLTPRGMLYFVFIVGFVVAMIGFLASWVLGSRSGSQNAPLI
jgi:hypothetical protein